MFFIALICLSCTPDRQVILDGAIQEYKGRYEYLNLEWMGEPVDLNDDGSANMDLFKEFDLSARLFKADIDVFAIGIIENYLFLTVPIQYIKTEEYGNPRNHNDQICVSLTAYISIDSKTGVLSFRKGQSIKETMSKGNFRLATGAGELDILSLRNDVLECQYECLAYDYASSQYVTSTVRATLRRFSTE